MNFLKKIKQYKLRVGDYDVNVFKKNVKNIRLAVYPPAAEIRISVPLYIGDDSIRNFVSSKTDWIEKHRDRILSQSRFSEKKIVSGEIHYFLGKSYILNVVETVGKPEIILSENTINLYIKNGSNEEKRKKVLLEWYRERLKEIIPVFIEKWEKIMRVKINEWRVKKMKSRWGSCLVQSKTITLNLDLATKSERCIEYVVVHELTHLFERGHNARFKTFMDKFLPDWRTIKAELNV